MNSQKHSLLLNDTPRINIKFALTASHDNIWFEAKVKSEYAIWIIQEGIVNIEYNKTTYTLYPGDIFLFYPQILYLATSQTGCRFWFIHFDAITGNNYQALHFYPFDGVYTSDQINHEADFLISGASLLENKDPFGNLSLTGALMLFLAKVMGIKYKSPNADVIPVQKSALARMQPALIYIGEHINEPIYVQDLANSVNLSEKYFITLFRKVIGVTPTHYIIQAKMKKAMEYLHEQKYSIKEVAGFVGYADVYTFSKAFKKIYGISPSRI